MRAPATAALLLAALSALPCRGTDDAGPFLSEQPSTESRPILNKFYQMLHARNTTQLTNFDATTVIQDFNFYEHWTTDIHRNREIKDSQASLLSFRFTRNDNNDEILYRDRNGQKIITNIDQRGTNNQDSTYQRKQNDNSIDIDSIDRNAQVMRDKDSKSRSRRVVSVMRSDETSTVAVTSPPLLMERRRKPGETGSSAPLLNYIFDTYSNTHQHHNRNEKERTGSGIYAAAAPEIEALVGSTAHLDCKVDALHDKLVSWVRRKNEEDPMELLYTGTQQYTADDRYSSRFIPPDIWRLEVREVRPSDAAHYDCQMPTHPPRTARLTLRVPEVSVRIVDGAGAGVNEQVCEVGSTVALRCEVRGLKMEGGPSLLWYRKEDLLNDDTTRGGISVRTEFGPNGANSVLRVARVRGDDAGRYSCSVARAPPPAPPPAHVLLHVIKGESLAELHQGGSGPRSAHALALALSVLLHLLHIVIYY